MFGGPLEERRNLKSGTSPEYCSSADLQIHSLIESRLSAVFVVWLTLPDARKLALIPSTLQRNKILWLDFFTGWFEDAEFIYFFFLWRAALYLLVGVWINLYHICVSHQQRKVFTRETVNKFLLECRKKISYCCRTSFPSLFSVFGFFIFLFHWSLVYRRPITTSFPSAKHENKL